VGHHLIGAAAPRSLFILACRFESLRIGRLLFFMGTCG
jgi:hypothetical protein